MPVGEFQDYVKVGRLKPDQGSDCVRVIVDNLGEIGRITREDAEELLSGLEPQPVTPSGRADLSISGAGVKVRIPSSNGELYVAVARQVRNMLDKWPWKKAAVFKPINY